MSRYKTADFKILRPLPHFPSILLFLLKEFLIFRTSPLSRPILTT